MAALARENLREKRSSSQGRTEGSASIRLAGTVTTGHGDLSLDLGEHLTSTALVWGYYCGQFLRGYRNL